MEQAFPGKGHLKAPEEEIRRLQRENSDLKEEKEILKKALAVRLQMVLDKLDQKLREGFRIHINLSCLFSKSQSVILLPS